MDKIYTSDIIIGVHVRMQTSLLKQFKMERSAMECKHVPLILIYSVGTLEVSCRCRTAKSFHFYPLANAASYEENPLPMSGIPTPRASKF